VRDRLDKGLASVTMVPMMRRKLSTMLHLSRPGLLTTCCLRTGKYVISSFEAWPVSMTWSKLCRSSSGLPRHESLTNRQRVAAKIKRGTAAFVCFSRLDYPGQYTGNLSSSAASLLKLLRILGNSCRRKTDMSCLMIGSGILCNIRSRWVPPIEERPRCTGTIYLAWPQA